MFCQVVFYEYFYLFNDYIDNIWSDVFGVKANSNIQIGSESSDNENAEESITIVHEVKAAANNEDLTGGYYDGE